VFAFGAGEDASMYIGSADFMTRNTQRRVEVACPIYDAQIRESIHKLIDAVLSDTAKARILFPDGSYAKKEKFAAPLDSQQYLMLQAQKNAADVSEEVKSLSGSLKFLKKLFKK